MAKRKRESTTTTIVTVGLVVLFIVLGALYSRPTNTVGLDFPNDEEGTIILVHVTESEKDPTTLFQSVKVPGVSVAYSQKNNEVTAGSPPLRGQAQLPAHITYSFEKNGYQQLYINGQLSAQSTFKPLRTITGFAIAEVDPTAYAADVKVFGESLIPPDVLREFERSR